MHRVIWSTVALVLLIVDLHHIKNVIATVSKRRALFTLMAGSLSLPFPKLVGSTSLPYTYNSIVKMHLA